MTNKNMTDRTEVNCKAKYEDMSRARQREWRRIVLESKGWTARQSFYTLIARAKKELLPQDIEVLEQGYRQAGGKGSPFARESE